MTCIGLAKTFIQVFHNILQKNPNELFGQSNTIIDGDVILPSTLSKILCVIPLTSTPHESIFPCSNQLELNIQRCIFY